MMTPFSTAALPFTMPLPWYFERKIFAHYFPSFPLSIDNKPATGDYYTAQYLNPMGEGGKHKAYGGFLRQRPLPVAVSTAANWKQQNMQTEVALAIARGITGFCVDVLSISDAFTGTLPTMLTAAAAVDARFKIVPTLDMKGLGATLTQAQAQSMVAACAASPAVKRTADGRLVLGAYNAPAQSLLWWTGLIDGLNAQGINVAFLPILLGGAADAGGLNSIAYGAGAWGTATPGPSAALSAAAAHTQGLIYMSPVIPQQFRPREQKFWEASNSVTVRSAWEAAINHGADWVQCITWNDFSESGQVCPYTDATLSPSIGTAFYDLTAYYGAWFMTGMEPAITQDVLYFFYRREMASAAHPNQIDNFAPVLLGGGPEEDMIELLAFLTQPGELVAVVGGVAHTLAAPAGITSFKVPLAPGVPVFSLQRNGSNVFSGAGPIEIMGAAGLPSGVLDMTYWNGSLTQAGLTAYILT